MESVAALAWNTHTTRDLADMDGRFTINAQAFDGVRGRRFLVFFSRIAN
jgi:hypothetical protein